MSIPERQVQQGVLFGVSSQVRAFYRFVSLLNRGGAKQGTWVSSKRFQEDFGGLGLGGSLEQAGSLDTLDFLMFSWT